MFYTANKFGGKKPYVLKYPLGLKVGSDRGGFLFKGCEEEGDSSGRGR